MLRLTVIVALMFAALATALIWAMDVWWWSGPGPLGGERFGLIINRGTVEVELDLWIPGSPSEGWAEIFEGGGLSFAVLPSQNNREWHWVSVVLPSWFLILVFVSYPALALLRGPVKRWRRKRHCRCVKCGYDLTGNVSGLCPECGTPVTQRDGAGRRVRKRMLKIAAIECCLLVALAASAVWFLRDGCPWHEPKDRLPEEDDRSPVVLDSEDGSCLLTEDQVRRHLEGHAAALTTYDMIREAWIKDAHPLECDTRFPSIYAGTCNDDQAAFLLRSDGYSVAVIYFDAQTGDFKGITTLSDALDKQCVGIRYWPLEFECTDYCVTEVICGTGRRIGDCGERVITSSTKRRERYDKGWDGGP